MTPGFPARACWETLHVVWKTTAARQLALKNTGAINSSQTGCLRNVVIIQRALLRLQSCEPSVARGYWPSLFATQKSREKRHVDEEKILIRCGMACARLPDSFLDAPPVLQRCGRGMRGS